MSVRLLFALTLLFASPAMAVPGPDSVAVLANEATAASLQLMAAYAKARHLPPGQLCTVNVPPYDDLPIADFRAKVVAPLVACLEESGALERIEAVVLMRGMPRRLHVKGQPGNLRVSLAAALAIARSIRHTDDVHVVGLPPGVKVAGQDAWRATWTNPYNKGPFRPGFEVKSGPFTHHMWLVTALDGYTYADAAKLIDSALAAEPPDLKAQWLLMKGGDKVRGVLDVQYPSVMNHLVGLLPNPIAIEPFQKHATGRHLGALVTGTASLGQTIDGNTWAAGALVDNITSLGARPENFVAPEHGGKQLQVSIARWVRLGVAGVHGAVAEPLNNCFPSRQFLVDYAGGATLAEAYWRNLPYVYWMNMTLGDPMVAPFARRPTFNLAVLEPARIEGQQLTVPKGEAAGLQITASAGNVHIARLRIFINGQLIKDLGGDSGLLELQPGTYEVLAVAQAAESSSGAGVWQSKGWRAWTLAVAEPEVIETDAGVSGGDSGCSATLSPYGAPGPLWVLGFVLITLASRGRDFASH